LNPIRIVKLDHVVLRVSNIKDSIFFYNVVLGCPAVRSEPDLGLYQFQVGASMIDLVPQDSELGSRNGYGSPKIGRNVDHIALTIEKFDYSELKNYFNRFGIRIHEWGRRFGADGYGPSVYLSDPDGNVVELKGPAEN